jgi:acyl-CoA thioesterase
MEKRPKASRVIDKMFAKDAFSQWLGIERLEETEGYCKLSMKLTSDMTNGFNIAHGGITYSIADSALAFAANARGIRGVSIETSIAHTRPAEVGDTLIAEAVEKSHTKRFGIYEVTVKNQRGELLALFKGTIYRTGKEWDLND